jgi:hypothetical protein
VTEIALISISHDKGVAMSSSTTRQGPDAIPLPPLTNGPHQDCLGGLLFGYDTGVSNVAEGPMVTELGLSTFTEGVHE